MDLQGRTIVITGGSSGIGLELAKVLTERGNEVIICGRSSEKLVKAKQRIPSCHTFQCDLSKQTERERFSAWVQENHPRCDILINNAAIVNRTDFFSDPDITEKAAHEMQTNFLAPLSLTKLFIPFMMKNANPGIIFITTGLVYAPRAVYPVYCATKSALHAFIQVLRMQKKDHPINFYEVLMPAVDTPWHEGKPPKIAIPVEKAVSEMIRKLEKDISEIRVGGAKILYLMSRIAPAFTRKKINSL